MRSFIFLFFLLTSGNQFSQFKFFNSFPYKKNYLPVYISYYPQDQPDSIKMYFKNAFQQKKIKVINKEEMQLLLKQESGRIFSIIKSDGNRSQSVLQQVEQLQEPVCSSLQINLQFNSEQMIDSLKWKTYTQPINPKNKIADDWLTVNIDDLKDMTFSKAIDAVVDSIIVSNKLQ